MYKVSAESIRENHKRITYLRLTVLFCLGAIGGGGGFLVYYLLDRMEEEMCTLQFDSVADLIQASITSNFESKVKIGQDLAKDFGVGCPRSEMWPNCPYDLDVFEYINVAQSGNVRISGLAPFVYPEVAEDFENFTKDLFSSNPEYPTTTGYSSFGFGIFRIENKTRYHDAAGLSSYGSSYNISVPILLMDRIPVNYFALMFNLHSEERRGAAIDNLLDCQNSSHDDLTPCRQSSLTDMIHTLIDRVVIQTTAIYTPIFPRLNQSEMVGISYVYIYWDEIMNITVPSSFPEFVVVVKSPTTDLSYSFHRGSSIPLGDGDHHNSNYNEMAKSILFTSRFVNSKSAQYRIIIYPTASFCDYYHSSGPILVLVGLVCMMFITSVLFGLYDYFMKSESLLRKFLLESKRLFVRFISHELRTPLNAVSLGLSLIETDLNSLISHPKYSKSLNPEVVEQLKFCVQSVRDANDNTNTSIVVLNDMLQYDKIESNSLQCECIETDIWDIIRHACHELSLQAKATHVTLTMKLQVDLPESDESWRVTVDGAFARLNTAVVVGDPIKLGQVVRNLISNALKFSPPGGEVTVHGYWVSNGLPETPMPKCVGSYLRFGSIRIEVRDEGPGITPQGKEILFREGVQLNANQLQSGQGSGLGLWIAKGITSIHGGAIGVECEEVGKGSMFYVELPLIEGIQSSPQSSQSQPHSPGNRVSSVNDNTNGESKSDGVVGHRVWSWRDPRNNIDQKNIITPTSKKNVSYFQSDPSTQQSQKVIPLNLTTRNTQGPADPNSDILTQKNIHPQISSDMSQANSARKYFSHDAFPAPRPLRILVVDDVKSIRKLFARALSNQGHSCDTACDGQECVDLFTKKSEGFPSSTPLGSLVPVPVAIDACPYDLVLMDSEMPVMNGPTATKIIRSLGFKELVVFGVTGNVLPEDVEMFMNHGVDAVLGKPLTLEKMWEEYDRIIKEKSQRSNLDLVSGERL